MAEDTRAEDRASVLAELFRVGAGLDDGPGQGGAAGPRNLCDVIDSRQLEPAPSEPPPSGAGPAMRSSTARSRSNDTDSDSDADERTREPTGAHTLSDDESDCPSEPDELAERTVELQARLRRARTTWALDDERTLKVVFKLLNAHVAQYQLNKMDELFDEFMPICERVRGKWYLKAIQSKAFCSFKQYRFKEALELFKEQERLMGASAPLCENIGHVCSSLSDYDQAEHYFRLAVRLVPVGRQHSKNSGGVYLGLGLLLDRRGRPREALPVLYQALELYKESCYSTVGGRTVFTESSLVAKAHMSVGHCHEHAGELGKAEEHMREAVAIFARTVGESSPLLAGALGSLGKVRVRQGAVADGLAQLERALRIEVEKDAFHLRTIWELLEEIKSGKEKEVMAKQELARSDLAAAFAPYEPLISRALQRVEALDLATTDPDTVSVLRKGAGEMLLLGGHNAQALEQLTLAAAMLRSFTHCDCTRLVRDCESLISVALERLNALRPAASERAGQSAAGPRFSEEPP